MFEVRAYLQLKVQMWYYLALVTYLCWLLCMNWLLKQWFVSQIEKLDIFTSRWFLSHTSFSFESKYGLKDILHFAFSLVPILFVYEQSFLSEIACTV